MSIAEADQTAMTQAVLGSLREARWASANRMIVTGQDKAPLMAQKRVRSLWLFQAKGQTTQPRRLPARRPPRQCSGAGMVSGCGFRAICALVLAISPLERDDLSANRRSVPAFCLRMIFSENRFPLFRIML